MFIDIICRIFFDKKHQQIKSEVLMLEPVNCKFWIDRNLSVDWYKRTPGLVVKGTIRAATVSLQSWEINYFQKFYF